MNSLNINLSDDLREFLEERRVAHGFDSIDELIEFYVRSEAIKLQHPQVQELLTQGLNSGEPVPMTADDWRKLRDRINVQSPGMKSAS